MRDEAPEEQIATRAQQRIYLLDSLDPSGLQYRVFELLELHGDLDIARLAQTFQEVCERHEALRSTFRFEAGVLFADIHRRRAFEVSVFASGSASDVRAVLEQASRSRFDLSSDPPIRLTIVQDDAASRILALVDAHHIVFDGESMATLLTQWRDVYEARPNHLSPEQLDFGDYASWEKQRAASMTDREYWRDLLSGVPSETRLPRRILRSGVRSTVARTTLPKISAAALRRFAREARVTEFSVYLAAYSLLQSHLTGQSDVVVGVPTSARAREELAHIVGMMTDTLPVRVRTDGASSVAELTRIIAAQLHESRRHSEVPLDEILSPHVAPGRREQQSVMDSLFTWDVSTAPESFGRATTHRLAFDTGVPKASLFMSVRPLSDVVELTLEAPEAVADADTLHSWLRLFTEILTGFPESTMMADICGPSSLSATAAYVEGASSSSPSDKRLDTLWQELVTRFSDRVAIEYDGKRITYRELDQRAREVAEQIAAQGIPPGALIAIALGRGIQQYAAVIGVFMARCAYVPVDPAYPADRRDYILRDSNSVALVEAEGERTIVRRTGATVVDAAVPLDTAYVIYTSGSTGAPKGVVVRQHSVINLALAQGSLFEGGGERIAQFASLSFDVSVAEMWMTWVRGGVLVPVPDDSRLGTRLEDIINRYQVSALVATPIALASIQSERLRSLKLVVSTGDACPPGLPSHFGGAVRFLNAYGPTETTVWASAAELNANVPVTIGFPLPSVCARIGSPGTAMRPHGVIDELWIGGSGVAHGYLGRPQLTDERFAEVNGQRWYNTGDLAMILPSGELLIFGRRDDQVKVNGYRIELAGIEQTLRGLPGVRDAAVGAPIVGTSPMLVAWLDIAENTSENVIRTALEDVLPVHEIPTAFVMLPALPIGPSGKIDKRALPIPGQGKVSTVTETPALEFVSRTWANAFGVTELSPDRNFFDQGGNSLLALSVFQTLRERYPEVELTDIFRFPTIRTLAERIESRATLNSFKSNSPTMQDRRANLDRLRRR